MRASHTSEFRERQNGFSLPELLVVIGLLGMLMSLLLPAVQQARGAAARISCADRMRQIGLALHNYHDTNGTLPAGVIRSREAGTLDPLAAASWHVRLLPFIEQDALATATLAAFNQDPIPWHDPPHVGLATVITIYICPADGRLRSPAPSPTGQVGAFTSYLGVSGGFASEKNGVLGMRPGIRLTDVTDGTSQTLMVGERPPSPDLGCGWWYTAHPSLDGAFDGSLPAESALNPNDPDCGGHIVPQPGGGTTIKYVYAPGRLTNPCDKYHFWSLHVAGANFVFADGSVHFLPYSISPKLRTLATRDGGEIVEFPD